VVDAAYDRAFEQGTAGIRRRHVLSRATIYAILVAFSVIYLLPLGVIVANSFRELPEIAARGLIAFPRSFSIHAWGDAWSSYCVGGTCAGVKGFFFNSLKMTIPATIISTAVGAVNGYILSKWRFTGSEVLFTCMALGVFIPGQIALMPWAFILGKLSLTNSTYGLILIHVVQGTSFTTLFCRNYYLSVPDDLIKAARIDGAGFFRIFWSVMLPMATPMVIVAVILQVTGIWNDFILGLVFAGRENLPMTVQLNNIVNSTQGERAYNVDMAATILTALVPLVVYFASGRWFVRGIAAGAVKG
jgi:glucose/mannose transport system permease protein